MNLKIFNIIFIANMLYGDIGGIVYQDLPLNVKELNRYGSKESNELGVEGVTVTVSSNGSKLFTTTTDENGVWSYATDANQSFRVEFSNWPDYLSESSRRVINSAIQFVRNGESNISFGLYDVNQYFRTVNPLFTTTIIGNGGVIDNNIPSLVTTNYTAHGLNSDFKDINGNQGEGKPYIVNAKTSETGAVWGTAYQASKKRMFVASSLWRHVGNIDNKLGYIFVSDFNKGKITGKIDLENVNGIHFGDVNRSGNMVHDLSSGPKEPNVDVDAYTKVGKRSYGDIDLDEKSQTLWAVNLFQQSLIRLDASSDNLDEIKNSAKQYKMSELKGVPTCNGGKLRPWALSIYAGKGYVGSICDASISKNKSDLKAYLSSFDLKDIENGLKTELVINMDYDRKSNANGEQGNQYFFPWSDEVHQTISYTNDYFWDYYNQPILTDIEFDKKGNAYLAFTDRYTLQIGFQNYPASQYPPDLLTENIEAFGEILKVCNIDGKLELEGNGGCESGISRDGDVDFFDDAGGDKNANSNGGALALIPGSNELITTVNSPHPSDDYSKKYWGLTGVETFSTVDGSISNWYAHLFAMEQPYRGKGVGLGDIELLNEPAPIEIGDRIWNDNDGDGIQDSDEVGISGVVIELLSSTKEKIASVITDANGYYLFSSVSGKDSSSQKYNLNNLIASKSYLIQVPNIKGDNKQDVLKDLFLTTDNKGKVANAQLHDSNAKSNNISAIAEIEPKIGDNIHSIDIGFKPLNPVERVVGNNNDNNGSECDCPAYKKDSVGIFQNKIIITLFLLSNLLILFYLKNEYKEI